MKVRILSLEYNNIRGLNNIEIQLAKAEKTAYPVSLIMMPNGTGKTTTLTLLRAIFDEQAMTWPYGVVQEFKPIGSSNNIGKFSVKLLIDNDIYHVVLEMNFKTGGTIYRTAKVPGGLDEGLLLPDDIKDFFSQGFVRRFILDGELAQEIVNSKSKEAHNSIKFLYQLNRLEEIKKNIDDIVDEERKNAEKTSAKSEQGLNNLKTRYENWVKTLAKLNTKKIDIQSKIITNEARCIEIEQIIGKKIKANAALSQKAKEIEEARAKNKLEIFDLTQNCLNSIRNPYTISAPIAERLKAISNKLQKLKLPQSTSKEFFIDLANEPACVCGREIGKKEKNTILLKADDYLANDQSGVINAIKTTVRNREYSDELRTGINALFPSLKERNKFKTQWERMQIKLEEAGDTEVGELSKEKVKLENETEKIKKDLSDLTTKDKSEQAKLSPEQNILLCEECAKEAEERLKQATNTVKISNGAEVVKEYLMKIEQLTLKKLKQKIQNDTNDKIKKIIKNDSLTVEGIDGHLRLKDRKGASMGQTLAIAYSFLGSMFDNSTHQLPFVVDSPAGALDLDVRRAVSATLPELFEQLIIFITSGERQGFVEFFYKDPEAQFLTIYRDGSGIVCCLKGQDKFRDFQDKAI